MNREDKRALRDVQIMAAWHEHMGRAMMYLSWAMQSQSGDWVYHYLLEWAACRAEAQDILEKLK